MKIGLNMIRNTILTDESIGTVIETTIKVNNKLSVQFFNLIFSFVILALDIIYG
jgi:hypothetical protein